MDDLPNGFLNYPKKRANFESAGDAIRKRRSSMGSGRGEPSQNNGQSFRREGSTYGVGSYGGGSYRGSYYDRITAGSTHSDQRSGFDGWSVSTDLNPSASPKKTASRSWGKDDVYHARDIMQYLSVPDPDSEDGRPQFDEFELSKIPETDRRWSWVEISISALQNNVMAIKGSLSPGTRMMAVVNADGYGHGAVKVARTALNSGAEYLGVATVDEGIELRKGEIDAPILIMSEPPIRSIPLLLAHDLMPAVTSVEFAIKYGEAADSIGMKAPFHLKVNTGMNRIGIRYDEVLEFLHKIMFHRALEIAGTFTHFATADTPDVMDFNLQRKRFDEVVNAMRGAGISPGIVHASNSAATLRYPEAHYDMVRVGLAMYGYYPSPETYGMLNLMPAMSVHARITQVNSVPVGEGVGAGFAHRSSGFVKTCTVPIGYGDGLKRCLSGNIQFALGGKLHKQVGGISTDQCMFEVDQRTRAGVEKVDPKVGDSVVIIGAQGNAYASVEEMARMAGSTPDEILIGFGTSRLPKVYR